MSKTSEKTPSLVRITSIINVDDKSYQPNDLVKNLPEATTKELLKKGRVSACEAGIEYCKKELKAEVKDHTAKPAKTEESDK